MKQAYIDMGTNTISLLVVETKRDFTHTILSDEARVARLGEGLKQTAVFSKAAIDRAKIILKEYKTLCQKLGVETVYCVGTAAFRYANNANDFVLQIKSEFGWRVKVIDALKEAQLIARATTEDFSFLKEDFFTLDIGGGSCELIWVSGGKPKEMHSFPFGVVTVSESHPFSALPTLAEITRLKQFIQQALSSLKERFKPVPKHLVATAGTPTTASALIQKLEGYDANKVHKSQVSKQEALDLFQHLSQLSLADRQELKLLASSRADLILSGLIILLEVMDVFSFSQFWVSDKGLRYGLFLDEIDRDAKKENV